MTNNAGSTIIRPAEPGYYDYFPYNARPRITWPNNARIAFWIAPNIEFYELNAPVNPSRYPWPRPMPDMLNYAQRDYGNRVGFHRCASVIAAHGLRASVSLSVAICDHYPEIIEACCRLDWELFSHGIYNTRFVYNMSEDQERAVIRDAQETILRASGQRLDGWLSPGVSHTHATQALLAEAGIRYTLDFWHDDQPTPVKVPHGRLITVPYALEVNDWPVLVTRAVPPARYLAMVKAQFDRLYQEGEESGTVMCLPIHPYLMGAPHRIGVLNEMLAYITGHDRVWLATGREIADWYYAHHYDAAVATLAARVPA